MQSNIKSENIKWNVNNTKEKIYGLLINTRNANAFTGKEGYKSIKILHPDCQMNFLKNKLQTKKSQKKF